MYLQCVLGGSGSGKSEYMYKWAVEQSVINPEEDIIVVVPEQYTMSIQKKIINMHPRKALLGIDVVSFERLAYKVFEEVGGENRDILDDTGKNLIIRRVMEMEKKNITYFGNNVRKPGFIAELKSVISELLQYGIDAAKIREIADGITQNEQRQLTAKLSDIAVIYDAFKKFIEEHFVTKEEILVCLCQLVDKSEKIKNATIILDGFTGFTPVQYKLIGLLLHMCKGIIVSVTIDPEEKINVDDGIQNIFHMSKETVRKLIEEADSFGVPVKQHILMNSKEYPRFLQADDLGFLEHTLFRKNEKYQDKPEHISMFEAGTVKEELSYVVGKIIELTRFEGYRYSDIAIVGGDISNYGKIAGKMLPQNNIPVFIDNKRALTDNPGIEFIRSALKTIEKDYSYESVFGYLRTGFSGLEREEIDELENYCIAVGIRGRKSWENEWKKKFRRYNKNTDLKFLNALRKKVYDPLAALSEIVKDKDKTVSDKLTGLSVFLDKANLWEQIEKQAEREGTGSEYEQLSGKIQELISTMNSLLGNEKVSLKEFQDILGAGLSDMTIGLIPPTADCVMVGDIERTRLDNVKVIFFVGVNEGIIPKKSEKASVLSETDRNYFESIGVRLSPTTREKAFTQRLYLYLIMTRASERLFISYSRKDSSGKSLLPSYLIKQMRKMFPSISLLCYGDALKEMGYVQIKDTDMAWFGNEMLEILDADVVDSLYGNEIQGSISAYEQFASCRFAYFLNYGLGLSEREEHEFQASDFGTVVHGVLEEISRELTTLGKSFVGIPDDERKALVRKCVEKKTLEYGNTILQDSARNEYMIERISAISDRTVWTIGKQLECGEFVPDDFEKKFIMETEVKKGGKRLILKGKIDRIDICENGDDLYVKVIDYKTGKSDFDLLKTYYGLKIQLITYLKAAVEIEKKKHPEKNVIPAGVLYYNVDNPLIEIENDALTDEQIDLRIQEQLRMKGVINDNFEIIRKLDKTDGKSMSVPVAFKKDGTINEKKSSCMSTRQFEMLENHVNTEETEVTKLLFGGSVDINPYKDGQRTSCDYCAYSSICGFTPDLSKNGFRSFKKLSPEEIWAEIDKENEEGEDNNGMD